MGVRSQFENKACLLSSKEMLMGREQSRIKKSGNWQIRNRVTERRVELSVCHLDGKKYVSRSI